MPKKAGEKDTAGPAAGSKESGKQKGFDEVQFIDNTKKQFRPAQLTDINRLETEVKGGGSDTVPFEALASAWDDLRQPGIAASYYEKKANLDHAEQSYLNAAYRYFDAFKTADDTMARAHWVERAISCYEQVLKLNPENLDAKTDLGLCYAEGTGNPMKGIMLLREVITANPKHENAQLNMGFLSVKSGQYEKAMERFNNVLAINPDRADVYIYKGETALQMGKQDTAMVYFQQYMRVSKDEAMKKQVAVYIEELKKSAARPQ
jgi:tetratricopeptide (TPR) repeat protein